MAEVVFDHVTRIYPGNDKPSVDDLNLDIKDGEFLVLVGPSGCGKSTTLRMLAGLEEVNKGRILIGGKDVTTMQPKDRDIAMVFQNYALYPHMTVYDNMAFGLKLRKTPKDEIKRRVEEAARILDISHLLDRKPKALSGGQRQAMALLMSTMTPIDYLILDEHTAALDPKTADLIMELTDQIVKEKNLTTIMVTHNLRYAVEYGNRLLMMHQGKIVLDKKKEVKEATSIDDILTMFNEISIECGN